MLHLSYFYFTVHHYQLGVAQVVVAAGEKRRVMMVSLLVWCWWWCSPLHFLWVLTEPF